MADARHDSNSNHSVAEQPHLPDPAHDRDSDIGRPHSQDDDREATELGRVQIGPPPSTAENASESVTPLRRRRREPPRWAAGIYRFWRNHVQLEVPLHNCRDHLANERTFLAYQRTSLALSMMGIVTAQLFNLSRATTQHHDFGYYILGKPLAALFQVAAIMVTSIGAHRFWRQQMSMARGKVWAGGWELWTIIGSLIMLLTCVFFLVLAADISVSQ